jgi:2-oxoglutarate ferredoxin oxidoreductase subunit delta
MTSDAAKPRARGSFVAHVDGQVCDGCGICIFFCKPAVFELSRDLSMRGVYPAVVVRTEACTDCGLCELGCPQLAICVTAKEADR